MVGLETALSIVWRTLVESKLISVGKLEEIMSTNPARIGKYEEFGQEIKPGAPANLLLFESNQSWKVDRDLLASKSSNTPYHGIEMIGAVTATFYKGKKTL